MNSNLRCYLIVLALTGVSASTHICNMATAQIARPDRGPARTETFKARDTVDIKKDKLQDTDKLLKKIRYASDRFEVKVSFDPGPWHALVRFPTPKPSGHENNDTVVMEWYAARDGKGQTIKGPAPAMIVMHILDGRMVIARMFANAFSQAGIHSFVMHMPHYGLRSGAELRPDEAMFLAGAYQAVADTCRARDAISALPGINGKIGIQGTSLGGFTAVVCAAVDHRYDPVFAVLAGGDLNDMIINGGKDTANIRQVLKENGYTGEKLKRLAWEVEPLRVAHRLNPKRTWLFSATLDVVVPPRNARALAKAIGLDKDHHYWATGNHYTAIIHLPKIANFMIQTIRSQQTGKDNAEKAEKPTRLSAPDKSKTGESKQ